MKRIRKVTASGWNDVKVKVTLEVTTKHANSRPAFIDKTNYVEEQVMHALNGIGFPLKHIRSGA
jgi:hypothetical protein